MTEFGWRNEDTGSGRTIKSLSKDFSPLPQGERG